MYHLVSSIFLPWNFACTCKRHHPFACFDKWTTSSLIPLTDLFQPSWFHSINFQSQRSLSSPTAYTVSPLNGFHAYLRSPSFFILLTFYSLSLSFSLVARFFVLHSMILVIIYEWKILLILNNKSITIFIFIENQK